MVSFLIGWINDIFLECKQIPPYLLLLFAPYLRSPFMGDFM